MTESEARSKIKYRIEVAREIAGNGVDGKAFEDLEIALQALKEIREYRELGTVEELQALKEKNEPKRLLTREEKYPQNYGIYSTSDRWCPCCRGLVFTGDWSVHKQNIMYKRIRCGCGQKLDWQ